MPQLYCANPSRCPLPRPVHAEPPLLVCPYGTCRYGARQSSNTLQTTPYAHGPKRRDKQARGPKRESQNPATKAHKLLQGPVTIDTANMLLRLLPHPPPLESLQVRERILSMSPRSPPPAGRTRGAAPRTGTPVHHAWSHPHPPPVERRIWQPTPGRTCISQRGQAGSPTG